MADIAGSVRIDVDLMAKQAITSSNALDQNLKKIDVNPLLAKHVQDVTKSIDESRKTVDQARAEVDRLSKSEGQNSEQLDAAKRKLAEAEAEQGRMIQQLKSSGAAWKSVSSEQESAGLKTSAGVSKLRGLKAELTANQAELVRTGDQLRHLSQDENTNGNATDSTRNKYQRLQAQQQALVIEAGRLQKSFGGLSPQMAAAADKAMAFSTKIQSAGERMSSLGSKATMGFTVPIVTALGVATKAATDYQYQLADIRKEVVAQGYSASQTNSIMKQLSADTLNWSKKFGVGTKEINDGMFELVSNGYNVKQAMGMMPELLKTMTANSDKSGQSIKLTASMLEQFGQNLGSNDQVIKNGNSLMNQMTEATHKSAMSLGDLQEISGNAGAAMHAMGVKTNEFMAISGRLTSAGIDASSVGTGLSAMMTRLGTGTGAAAKDLKKYNIQVFDSKGKMKDIFDILGQMQGAYAKMNDKQRQSFMYNTIGQENMKVGMTLMDANLDRYKSLSSEIEHSNGTVDKYNKTMRNTSQFTMAQFKSSLGALEIEFGQRFLPTLTPIIRELTSLMKQFEELDPATQKMIINTGLMVAAGGPALSLLGKLTSGLGSLGLGATKMMISAGRMTPLFSQIVTKGSAAGAVVEGIGAASEGGATSLLSLGGSALTTVSGLGSLALAAAPVVLGVAALGTASYFAIKAAKEHDAQIKRQEASMDEYGAVISSSSQKSIKSFNDLHQNAQNDMAQLDTSVGKQSKQLSSDVVSKYSQMADLVIKQFDKTKKKGMAALSDLSSGFGAAGQSWVTKVQNGIDDRTDGQTSKVEKAKKTINSLLKSVDGDFTKLSNNQRTKLNEAEQYIDSQVSAFGMAYKDQQALYKAYVQQHGTITDGMYKQDVKSANSAYSKSSDQADKDHKKDLSDLKSALKNHQITQEQFNQAEAMLDAKRNQQQAQSSLEYIKTEKAAGDAYNNNGQESLRTKQKLDDEYTRTITDENGKKEKLYWDDVDNSEESASKWIADHKKDNEKYIKQQVEAHGTIKQNLDKFQKSQEKAYEAMGMDADHANAQAKVDADELAATTTKAGEKAADAASKVHDNYIKALNKGSLGKPADVAKQWGLDLSDTTSKIDLGKYGTKTAKDFWDDVQSGSKTGYEESKVYFASMMADFKSRNLDTIGDLSTSETNKLKAGLQSGVLSLKDLAPTFGHSIVSLFPHDLSSLSSQEMKTLRQGLKDGVVSLGDLNGQFNGKIMGLFPKDLSKIGKEDIATLKKGLKDGTITSSELKERYGKQYKSIFKQDLSKLGKSDIQSLQTGLDLGIITKSDLKAKYGKSIENIFKHSLKSIGKSDIDTLTTGIELGIPGAKTALTKLKDSVKKGAKINIKGEGTWTMDQLNAAYKSKKIDTENYLKVLAAMVKGKTDIDLSGSGKNTMTNYNNGVVSGKQEPIKTVNGLASNITTVLTLNNEAVGAGKDTMDNFDQGLAKNGGYPIGTAGKVAKAIASNIDQGGSTVNGLSKVTGGKSTYTAQAPNMHLEYGFNKTGTKGRVPRDGLAVVGDGGKPELIDYGNGRVSLSPGVPTVTNLPANSQVFSGEDTEKAMPVLKMMGMPMFAKGTGGSIMDWIKGAIGDVFKFFEHPIQNWNKLIDSNFMMNLFPGSTQSNIGPQTKDWEKKQTSWLKKLAESGAANPGGAGVKRWTPMVKRALAMLGLSTSDGMVNKVLSQINTESGGNPKAVGGTDGLSDGRAMGLMQVKPGTFAANGGPKFGSWDNGFASIYAGLHYAMNRYGKDLSFLGQGHGYDKGGESFEKQLAWVSEHNQREIHIPDDQSSYSKYLTDQAVKMSFGQQAYVATSAEQASGVHNISAPQVVKNQVASGTNNLAVKDLVANTQQLLNAITGKDLHVAIKTDMGTIAEGVYPMIKLLLGQDTLMDNVRGGLG